VTHIGFEGGEVLGKRCLRRQDFML